MLCPSVPLHLGGSCGLNSPWRVLGVGRIVAECPLVVDVFGRSAGRVLVVVMVMSGECVAVVCDVMA